MIERMILKYSVNWPIKYRKWIESGQPHKEILDYGGELVRLEESEPNIWDSEILVDTDHPDSDQIMLMGARKGFIMALLRLPQISYSGVVTGRENEEILTKVKKTIKKAIKELTVS